MPRSGMNGAVTRATLSIIAALISVSPAAAEIIDPAAYAELAIDRQLPLIIADIKQTLPDPYSIRDLTVCPARVIKLRDGKVERWGATFAMNTKTDAGGYSGFTGYAMTVKNGRIDLHVTSMLMPSKDGFDALINRSIMKRFEKCTPIPNETVQALLERPIGSGAQ